MTMLRIRDIWFGYTDGPLVSRSPAQRPAEWRRYTRVVAILFVNDV